MSNTREKGIIKSHPSWLRYGIAVLGLHLSGLVLLIPAIKEYPQLLGIAFLAYTLGLRHVFDVDHIAAIDNTVRKMVQQKKNPMGIGFFFSIGHSSVVLIMTLITAFSIVWVKEYFPQLEAIGGLVGTAISGVFLILIGLFNLYIWIDIHRLFVKMNKGFYDDDNLEQILLNRGFIARFLGPLYRLINKSWHVYPIGFLFGLGFDTASEVALLAISANAASESIPYTAILSLPLMFAAGMSLMDTADGIFMTTA